MNFQHSPIYLIKGYRFNNAHDNMSTLEAYFWRAHYHWASRLGYNWTFVILACFGHNWTMCAWNYMDIAIAVFGRGMYFRFKCLYEEAAKKLLPPEKLRWINSKQGICDGMCSPNDILKSIYIYSEIHLQNYLPNL